VSTTDGSTVANLTVICIPAEAPEIWVPAAVAGVSLSTNALEKFNTDTLWLFNIAMENGHL